MEELKPCPFCGGKAVMRTSASKVCAWAKCTACGAESSVFSDHESAAEAWNRRAAE